MKCSKKAIASMELAYAVGRFCGDDQDSLVVGVEKHGPIERFALDGTHIEQVAEGPGGVMTICQVPGRGDQVLATYQFFSPNCGGDDAKIVSYTRGEDGTWQMRVVCDLPYVHRFGLLEGAGGELWLIACTIKSACAYKEDWRFPGKVYGARIDRPFEDIDAEHQLKLDVIADTQLRNHGFWTPATRDFALVSTDDGVFRFEPPAAEGDPWVRELWLSVPTSDICLVDFDGDGVDEMLTLAPFHGEQLSVYKRDGQGKFQLAWRDPEERPFLHAIWGGTLAGSPCAIVGNRKGGRDLLRVWFEDSAYHVEVLDHDFGPANCLAIADGNQERIIACNRETNQVALYDVES